MAERAQGEVGFGNRIREVRHAQGLPIRTLAERVGVSFGQMGRLERGDRELSLTMMRRIAAALGCGVPELFLPEDLQPAFVTDAKAPPADQPFVFSQPSSGFGRPWPIPLWGPGTGYSPHGCICFSTEFLERYDIDPLRCVVIEVRDASMAPNLPAGSVALVDRRYNAMIEDEVCAFLLPDGEPTIRRLERAADRWILKSDNAGFSDRLWQDTMKPLGLVLWTSRMVFTPPHRERAQTA